MEYNLDRRAMKHMLIRTMFQLDDSEEIIDKFKCYDGSGYKPSRLYITTSHVCLLAQSGDKVAIPMAELHEVIKAKRCARAAGPAGSARAAGAARWARALSAPPDRATRAPRLCPPQLLLHAGRRPLDLLHDQVRAAVQADGRDAQESRGRAHRGAGCAARPHAHPRVQRERGDGPACAAIATRVGDGRPADQRQRQRHRTLRDRRSGEQCRHCARGGPMLTRRGDSDSWAATRSLRESRSAQSASECRPAAGGASLVVRRLLAIVSRHQWGIRLAVIEAPNWPYLRVVCCTRRSGDVCTLYC